MTGADDHPRSMFRRIGMVDTMRVSRQSFARAAIYACLSMAAVLPISAVPAETGLPWSSGFETGNLSEWNGFDTGTVLVTSDVAAAGAYSAYVQLLSGTLNDNYLEHYFGDHRRTGMDPVDEVYLRFESRFEPGYEWPASQGHKLALLNLTDENGQRRYQVYVYVNSQGEYQVDNSHIDTWDFYGLSQNIGTPAAVRFGQWDIVKLHVRLNDPGSSNGVVRLWINGEQKMERRDLNLRDNTSFSMNKLILSSYTTNESGGVGIQRYDSWVLSETNPGAGSPPSAPTDVHVTDP